MAKSEPCHTTAFRGAAVMQFSYGHHAVGVRRRDPGTVRPVVAAVA
jgi:hypothetical protein